MKRGLLKFFPTVALSIFSLLFVAPIAKSENVATAFNDANRSYEEGKFSDAAARYEKIVQSGSISTPLFFNLGNAYLKSGQIGRAIVAYQNAKRLSPRDVEVRANLQFARNQAGGGASTQQSFWENWIGKMTVNEWAVLTSAVFSLWFIVLAIRQWRNEWKNSFRGIIASLGLLTVFLIVCLISAIRLQATEVSVVIVPEAVVRRGPYEESPSVFALHDGSEVKLLDRKNEWLEIEDQSHRTGWLTEKQLMPIH